MAERSVWKYPLEITGHQIINVPKGAKPLFVAEQLGILCLWMEVNPDAQRLSRHLIIAGTGHPIRQSLAVYIGSALCDGGMLVWHVYDGGYGAALAEGAPDAE